MAFLFHTCEEAAAAGNELSNEIPGGFAHQPMVAFGFLNRFSFFSLGAEDGAETDGSAGVSARSIARTEIICLVLFCFI